MKVVLPVGRNWTNASAWLARELADRHAVTCYAMTHYRRWAREAIRQGFRSDHVFYVNEGARKAMASTDDVGLELERLEHRYGDPTLWPFAIADRHIGALDHAELLRLMVSEFTRIERFLDQVRPDAIVFDTVDRMGYLFMFRAARERGIVALVPTISRISGRYAILDNPLDWHARVFELYQSFRRNGLPEDEREQAASFMADFVRHGRLPSYASYTFEPPAVSGDARKGWRYMIEYLGTGGREEYSSTPPIVHAARSVQRATGWRAHRFDPRFEQPVDGERFVLFPLQVHPEASILVQAHYAVDQVAVVQQVAMSLPVGYKLYVKEHFGAIGTRNPGFYQRLKRIPNVRLISGFEKSHDLIKRADLIATITSTVGWESLLYGKPVITLGHTFYNAFDEVRRVANLRDLPDVAVSLLREYKPDSEALLCFVAAVLGGTVAGELDPGAPAFLAEENLSKLLQNLEAELGLTGGH